ncbi:MAG: hypothetical protein KA157_08395 [Aliarcobacter sp.]|nr:hypothetical protein [Aliarcobacter sp.]
MFGLICLIIAVILLKKLGFYNFFLFCIDALVTLLVGSILLFMIIGLFTGIGGVIVAGVAGILFSIISLFTDVENLWGVLFFRIKRLLTLNY